MKKSVDATANTVSFDFEDGGDVVVFELAKCRAEIQTRLALHGAGQKIGDGYAGMKAEADPIKFAREVVGEIIKTLYSGDWRGASVSRVSILLEAFALASGKTVAEVQEAWDSLSDDDKKTVQAKPKFKVALGGLKIQREQEKMKREMEKLAAEEAEAAAA